jgi:hypothetical protein
MDQSSSDLAVILADEFAVWFRNLGPQGFLPRAFTGVTKDRKQAIITLNGLPFDRVQGRDFLVWLCRTEQFVAYAYASHVGIIDDSGSGYSEAVEISASSDRYDVTKTLDLEVLANNTFKTFDRDQTIVAAGPKNGIFLGMQRSTRDIPSESQQLFRELWKDLRDQVMWRQR